MDEAEFYFRIKLIPTTFEEGGSGVTIILEDITEQKLAEKALQESEEKYRLLVENASEAITMLDIDGRFQVINDAAAQCLGGQPKDYIGKTLRDALPQDVADERIADIREVIQSEQGHVRDVSMQLQGETRWFHASTQPVRDSSGKVSYALSFTTDITKRKRAEDALRESEEKYSTLVEKANDGVVIVQDGICKFANNALAEISGHTVEEIVGVPFLERVLPEYRDQLLQRYKLHMAGEEITPFYEIKIQCKDGTIRDVEASIGIIQYGGDPALMAIVRDITERKQKELRENVESS